VAGGDSSSMRVLPYHPALVADRGEGCRIWDVDGNEYFDLNMAYGPLLFGHRPPFLMASVIRQLEEKGSQLGFPQELTYLAAEKVKQLYPSIELLRFANSGTEAIASAVRLARTFTGKPNVILFEGHYHGWSDGVFHKCHVAPEMLSADGFTPAIAGTNGMAGAPLAASVVPWNDIDALERALHRLSGTVAAVLMEPVMGNAGVIEEDPGYLKAVRELTRKHSALLIFDEVITGMRVAAGGAQQLYDVAPDITILSKALGCGFPVALFGASAEIMDVLVNFQLFHGGVYSGNALVLAAVDSVLTKIIAEKDQLYPELNSRSAEFTRGLDDLLVQYRIPHRIQSAGTMLAVYLLRNATQRLRNYRDVCKFSDAEKYIRLQHTLLDYGVYIHPNHFEPWYLSAAHSLEDIHEILNRCEDAIRSSLQ
jgi:glutamate-1-semialdehyde 2,1-aminomutase